jgi:hypothetical protein
LNLEFTLLGAVVVVSWMLALSLDSVFGVLIAALVFFSKSIPVNILFLISLNIVAFIQSTLGGRKNASGRTQKRFGVLLLGGFAALLGSAIPNPSWSYPLLFFGLLLTVANAASSFFFYAQYESLSLRAFLQSIALPSLVAINVLFKIKSGMKAEFSQLWDVTLLILGLSTFLLSSMLAMAKRRLKSEFIYLSLSWIGLLLYLLVIDGSELADAGFAATAISAVVTVSCLDLAAKLGARYFSFAKIVALGLPGSITFAALMIALKMTAGLNLLWFIALGIGFVLQSVAIIGARPNVVGPSAKLKIRFWLAMLAQFASGIAIFWLNRGAFK